MNTKSTLPQVVPSINGSDYFNNRDPNEYNVENYVIFRGDLSLSAPGLVAKHWNGMRKVLLKSSSPSHAEWARGAKVLTKSQVQKLVKNLSLVLAKDSLNANESNLDFGEGLSVSGAAPSGVAPAPALVSGSGVLSGVAPAPALVSGSGVLSGVAPAPTFVFGSDILSDTVPAPALVSSSSVPSGVAPAPVLISGSDIPSGVGPAAFYCVDSSTSSQSASSRSVSSQSVSAPSIISSSTTSHDLPKSSKEAMKADYVTNFNSYKGDNWVLSSGVRFDDKIFLRTIDKKNESSLHSFVLDSRELPRYMRAFEDCEVEDVKSRLEAMKYGDDSELPKWQMDIFNYYDSVSAIDMASSFGYRTMITFKGEGDAPTGFQEFNEMVYDFMHAVLKFFKYYGTLTKQGYYQCPDSISERKFMLLWSNFFQLLHLNSGVLTFDEGEVYSAASANRKNVDRTRDDRQAVGHKIDGILYCVTASNAEIGAIEGGKKDEGSYGTKCLVDSVKMAKVLKDMFDFACTRAGGNGRDVVSMKKQLETYGFLVSKLRVEFVSFKHLGGRHFYFNREVEHFIPDLLTDEAVPKICLLAIQFLLWRSRIEATAKEVGNLINGRGSLRPQKYELLPTLPTPPSSPKSKKKKLVNSE
ncbi:hypothetical protein BGX27_003234 [Mortierella sp. AM989]|nr:hypothetical protein BGX27_003234 [Mortierella sp. AM989]